MRHFENEKGASKKRRKNRAYFQKRKESTIITIKKNILLKSVDRLKLIIRKPIIPKRNEDEGFKKSFS
jgi:hypothetical protein